MGASSQTVCGANVILIPCENSRNSAQAGTRTRLTWMFTYVDDRETHSMSLNLSDLTLGL